MLNFCFVFLLASVAPGRRHGEGRLPPERRLPSLPASAVFVLAGLSPPACLPSLRSRSPPLRPRVVCVVELVVGFHLHPRGRIIFSRAPLPQVPPPFPDGAASSPPTGPASRRSSSSAPLRSSWIATVVSADPLPFCSSLPMSFDLTTCTAPPPKLILYTTPRKCRLCSWQTQRSPPCLCYSTFAMSLELLWSFILMCFDIHALKHNRDLHRFDNAWKYVLGDWIFGVLAFAAASAAGALDILMERDVQFCNSYPYLACSQYKISVILTCLAWSFLAASAASTFFLLASFF